MDEFLIKIPDDLEIKKAVFAIHGEKAPGPEGFSANFYQGFWDIIGGGGSLQRDQRLVCLRPTPKTF